MPKPAKDVPTYIREADPQAQPILKELRKIILSEIPTATEKISWGMPFFIFNDKKVSIAAYKAHVSIALSTDLPADLQAKAAELGYQTGQKRLNIQFSQKVPLEFIKELLKDLVKQA